MVANEAVLVEVGVELRVPGPASGQGPGPVGSGVAVDSADSVGVVADPAERPAAS